MTETPQERYTPEVRLLLNDWYTAAQQLAKAEAHESNLRRQCADLLYPDRKEGTQPDKIDIGDGCRLECSQRLNRTIDKAGVNAITHEQMAQFGLPAGLFEHELTLNLAMYRKLTDTAREFIARYVTETEGMPALKVERVATLAKSTEAVAAVATVAAGSVPPLAGFPPYTVKPITKDQRAANVAAGFTEAGLVRKRAPRAPK